MTISISKSQANVSRSDNFLNLALFDEALTKLQQQVENLHHAYTTVKPYPHLVIDDLFAPELLDRLVREFPKAQERDWLSWNTKHELKTTSKGIDGLSIFTQMFCLWLNSQEVIKTIQQITDVDNLVGDPLFHGAGLHEMYRDGWLEMHADYTKHFSLPLMRRLNILIYLNRDWDVNWGGDLALQNPGDPQSQISYPPLFNRTIIFPTTNKTFHGVPQPLSCPLNRSRQLLSIYYWTPVPMPLWSKVGTPLLWASNQKKNLKKILGKSRNI